MRQQNTGEVTSTSTLTFTSANWNNPQNVTVTGIDDDLVDGTQTTNVTVSINDAASDNDFDAVADQTVSVTTTDDDVAGFTVAETEGSTVVSEAGGTDTFNVVLNAQTIYRRSTLNNLLRYWGSNRNQLTHVYLSQLGYSTNSYSYGR